MLEAALDDVQAQLSEEGIGQQDRATIRDRLQKAVKDLQRSELSCPRMLLLFATKASRQQEKPIRDSSCVVFYTNNRRPAVRSDQRQLRRRDFPGEYDGKRGRYGLSAD